MAETTSLNTLTTSLKGFTSEAAATTAAAKLTLADTTVTAFEVPGATGVAVVDGTTLRFRDQGITLANGQVFSLGIDGLVDSTTSDIFEPITIISQGAPVTTPSSSRNSTISIPTAPLLPTGLSTLTSSVSVVTVSGTQSTPSGGAASTAAGSSSGTPSSTSSAGAAAATRGLSAGKAAALLGALGGVVVYVL